MEIRESLQVTVVDKRQRNQMRRIKEKYRQVIKTLLEEIDADSKEQDGSEEEEEQRGKSVNIEMRQSMDLKFIDYESIQQEKVAELQKMQEDISQLKDLMQTVSEMVEEQGEALEDVEEQVETTHVNTKKTNSELLGAQKYNNAYRKKLAILVGLLLVLFIIILC